MASYSCSECGAPIVAAQNRCRQCGSEIDWDQAVGRVRYVNRIPKSRRRRRSMGSWFISGIMIVTVLAMALFAGLWGIRRGLEGRNTTFNDTITTRWQQGMSDLFGGDVTGARDEFSRMTMLETPTAPTVTATVIPAFESVPVGTPEISSPGLNAVAIEQALVQIQAELDTGNWPEAITRLQDLSQQAPGTQAGLIDLMLFNAHFNQALDLESSGDIEGASLAINEALRLRPGNVPATEIKRSIELYVTGTSHMGGDWAAAIAAFTELFAHDPDFQDTPDQLFLAYTGYADSVRYSDPCLAVERYQLSLQVKQHPQVQVKLADARQRCSESSIAEVPEKTPEQRTGGATPFVNSGRIAYTFFDEYQTHHITRYWDIKAGMPSVEISRESLQPDIGPQGQFVVRSTNADEYGITVIEGPGLDPVRMTYHAGDSLPRWSPEGNRILFTSSGRNADQLSHLYILNISSGAIRDLGPGRDGDWSPEGRRIVYQGCDSDGSSCGLWILNLIDGQRLQLTSTAGDSKPVWSPNGRSIAFMSNGRSPTWDVFVLDIETGAIPYFALEDAIDGLPAWSPDGRTIAILSNREGDWAIYAWSLEDLSVNRLFPVEGSLPAWQEAGLAWEPPVVRGS